MASKCKISFPMPRKTEMHTSVPQKTKERKRNRNNPDIRENYESKDTRKTITSDDIFVPGCMVQAFIDRGILPKRVAKALAKQYKNKLNDSSPCSVEVKLSRILDEKNMMLSDSSGDDSFTSLTLTEDMIIKLGIQHQCLPSFSSLNWKSVYSSAACDNAESRKLVECQMEAMKRVKIVGMMRHKTVRSFEDIFESGRFSSTVTIAAHMTRTENRQLSSVELMLIALQNFWFDTLEIKIGNSFMHVDRSVFCYFAKAFKDHDNYFLELPSHKVPMHLMIKLYQWMIFDDTQLLFDSDFLSVYNMAKFLDVTVLLNQFWSIFATSDATGHWEQEAFQTYQNARKMQCEDMMTIMLSRVQKCFLPLVASQDYVEFDPNEVIFVLKMNTICVNSEDEMFFCAVRWLEHDWKIRRLFLKEIMSTVRFRLLSPWLHRSIMFKPETKTIAKLGQCKGVRALLWDACLYGQAQLAYRLSPSKELDNSIVHKYSQSHIADRSWAYCPGVPHHHDVFCQRFRPLTYGTFNIFLNLLHSHAQEYMDELMYVPYKHWHTYRCCKDIDLSKKSTSKTHLRAPVYSI